MAEWAAGRQAGRQAAAGLMIGRHPAAPCGGQHGSSWRLGQGRWLAHVVGGI